MSKEDYVRILVHTPAKVVLALAIAFGGGASYVFVLGIGDGSKHAQSDLDSCLIAYAEARSIANQQSRDITELSEWAAGTLRTLSSVQRLEALDSAPASYSSARGLDISH